MKPFLVLISLLAMLTSACSDDVANTTPDMMAPDVSLDTQDMAGGTPVDANTSMDMTRPCGEDIHCARGEICVLVTGTCGVISCEFCVEGQVCDTNTPGVRSCTNRACLTEGACPQPYEEPTPCQNDQACEPGNVCGNTMTCTRVACEFCTANQVCYENADGTKSCSKPE